MRMNQVTKRRALRSNDSPADEHSKLKTDDEDLNSDGEELSENEEDGLDATDNYSPPVQYRVTLSKSENINIRRNERSQVSKSTRVNIKKNQTSQADNKYLYLCALLAAVSLILLGCYYSGFGKNSLDCSQIPSCSFKSLYKQLQDEFQKQNKWSWKVIRAAVDSVINSTRHEQPAVILLVASRWAEPTSSCLANRLASSLEKSFNNRKHYPRLNSLEGDADRDMKEKIDATFRESFDKNDHRVILLERLDALSADSAMILHSYCDHENAPYKDVVILMTAATDASVESSELTVKKMDQIAWKHLDSRWEDLHEEKRVALLSRITTSVALILPEDEVPQICTQYATL
ncbi:torsin-1A-interacting protein 1-like [Centruroides sculpturatus]|uniref:torsin-1A-interacting protein 1-like n=1 Tax=Centruroides sculpturatus TaxID=218467 RepID=UPI000C6D2359|nr:torsin-1A-interacting protein 1-like [Centruroides sculpturatus]